MSNSTLKTVSLSLILAFQLFGGESSQIGPRPSVLKSTLIPGWGEHSFQSSKRGYLFNGIEAALWIFAGVAASNSRSYESDLFYAAKEYGQISDPQLRSDIFMDRVSKYDNMDVYNEQMLRNRQRDLIYSAENGEYWNWESDEKRIEYFDIKTQRYIWRQRLTYSFGAIALNHLVSTMDALFLKRNSVSLTVAPQLNFKSAGLLFSLSF
ncbi:MAG: hypothetical protein HQ508_05400 [Candidatus Marinimicrobia bacterium]|nr:hypothetical protein [Candidatus Neomarinimicrobiota bacterium]